MSAFHEVRLPARLTFGSTCGVERRTEIVTLASGHERRSTPWAHGRRRYLIGAGLRSLEDAAALTAFFEARRGRLHGFRFLDPTDHRSGLPGAEPAPLDQLLGHGDGAQTQFQLIKAYGEAVRPIAKPEAGSVRLAVDGIELSAETFAVDETTGQVSLNAPPTAGAAVSAGFRFDTPVRFDSDRLDFTLETFAAGRLAAVPLIELRV